MNVFLCQSDIRWEDKAANFTRVRELLASAQPPRGSLLVLPEMFATGFTMNVPAIHEAAGGETEKFLAELAAEYQSAVIGGLVTLGPEGKGRNQALAVAPDGKVLARYSKIQPFSLGGETQSCGSGTEVVLFSWGDFQIAPFVCYDLRFPELFRVAAWREAEVLVVIANWPVKRIGHWVTLLQARAIENQAYVIGVNRSGTDPSFQYTGRSLVVDPHGQIIADAGIVEGVAAAEISRDVVVNWRRDFPALRDIHPQFIPAAG
ncbi:MAG TPA: carbon-nitrogen family hydrolase [Verrucomicrobiae bacterium]|nr:carbon-nitrogen family hydrolase [Verrucomicrobiae bacterium]